MIIKGVFHWMNSNIINNENQNMSEQKIEKTQKRIALVHFLLGVLLISIGIIEKMNILQTPIFIAIYIILVVIPLVMIIIRLLNN